ncbi:MAG: alpha/beta hydrolase [Kiritimatiellia bacterium]
MAATPTLVLLPGLDGTGDLFEPLLRALAGECPCVVIRYPTDQPLDYPALEALVRRELPTGEPFVLLGESFSGPIAVSIAASAPAGLRGLVLCASFLSNPRPALSWLRKILACLPVSRAPGWLRSRMLLGPDASPELRRALAAALAKVLPDVLRARMSAVLSVDVIETFKRVKVPTLYLRGDQDRVVPRRSADLVQNTWPAANVVSIRAPHLVLQAAPVEDAAALRGFLHGLAQPQAPR